MLIYHKPLPWNYHLLLLPKHLSFNVIFATNCKYKKLNEERNFRPQKCIQFNIFILTNRSYDNPRSLRSHCKYQSRNKCTECSREFCTAPELMFHQIEGCEKPIDEDHKPTPLDLNGLEYQVDMNLESQDEDEDEDYQQSDDKTTCHLCDKSYSNKSNLRFHLRKNHSIKGIYRCTKCGKNFTFKKQLKAHREKHAGMCNSAPGASIEDDGFIGVVKQPKQPARTNVSAIRKRRSAMQTENRRLFQCEDCGRAFTFRSNLRTHQRSVHSNQLPYTCNECGEGFSYKKEVRLHQLSAHLAVMTCLYECWLCHET